MPDNNRQLARLFEQMADVEEILGGNRFRVNAFQRAARVLGELTTDVSQIEPHDLKEIEGVGEGTAKRITEYLSTGKIVEHDKLMKQIPPGVVAMLEIPGLGPKTVATFWKDGGVTDMATLRQKLETDELEGLPRMGKKKIEQIRKNLTFAETANQRLRIGKALPLARWFVDQLRKVKGVKEANYAGSLRRGRETIGDIDLLVSADAKDAAKIAKAFSTLDVVADVIGGGATKTSIRTQEGVQVDLRIVEPENYGAAMLYFTGSKAHNVRLRERAISRDMKLNEYGLYHAASEERSDEEAGMVAGKTEQDVYRALDLAWIPPELREDHGEIRLAEKNELPTLIELGDIQAELHAHTSASDGVWSIRELAAAAAERGFHTVAVTDHSKGQAQAHGLSVERLEKHIEAVRQVAHEMKDTIRILAGSEVDILADGKLDYPDSVLKELDIVVASPHAALTQDPTKATRRLLKAMDNRYVTIMGHPTGRIINRREGLHPDIGKIVNAAADRGVALEINANHYRLDLRDAHARAALEAGCKLAIDTDAHGPADLDQLVYGILTARRAGATKDDVVNCLSKTALTQWIASTRP